MLFAKWSERSLRSWVAIGMALILLPVTVSALVDHMILSRGVISALQDVSFRYREQIAPTQELRLELWEAGIPVNEYLGEHEAKQVSAYRELRTRIEDGFAGLHEELGAEPKLLDLLARARTDWSDADRLAGDLLSGAVPSGDVRSAELVDRFDALLASADDKLRVIGIDLDKDLEADHQAALLSYERAEWVAAICAGVALLLMLAGIIGIGRIMVVNVERLIDGARKFADGDRTHRIAVQVPPELRRVADEFNKMVERIHESEAALAEEARVDALTGLANRRAFDEAMDDAFARMRRLGERVVLLVMDIDHFKKVNDTHGHGTGDDVLRAVGETLRSNLREVDKAFRIGGEEFAVLMAATDLSGAKMAAERLRIGVAATRTSTQTGELSVTTSVGIALGSNTMRPDELLKTADEALYTAKTTGRDRIVVAETQTRAEAS
jgi:diguanylate cyclase (GGDEF)-like protein